MTEDFQKRLFARNLAYYVNLSGKSQKEIADRCGFSDVAYFRTVFKRKIGKSIREYLAGRGAGY